MKSWSRVEGRELQRSRWAVGQPMQPEGYAIDRMTPSVYAVLGHDKFVELSRAFYSRVYGDDERPEFRRQFDGRPMEHAVQNQVSAGQRGRVALAQGCTCNVQKYEFFIQRMGGPNLYTQRKTNDRWHGHPALRARHAPFQVTTSNADRWIHHMKLALTDVGIEGPVRVAMEEFFADVAYFLRNTPE